MIREDKWISAWLRVWCWRAEFREGDKEAMIYKCCEVCEPEIFAALFLRQAAWPMVG